MTQLTPDSVQQWLREHPAKARGLGVVYVIRCIVNNRQYIGSTENYSKRIASHMRLLQAGKHHNLPLQQDWLRYGGDKFLFEIECYAHGLQARKLEAHALANIKPYLLYNINSVFPASKWRMAIALTTPQAIWVNNAALYTSITGKPAEIAYDSISPAVLRNSRLRWLTR